MEPPNGPTDDEALYASIAAQLVAAVGGALRPWVEATVSRFTAAYAAEAAVAGERCAAEVSAQIAALVALDIDAQRTTPLALLRSAGRYPTAVLSAAGVPPVVRDPFDERNDPDDVYGISPATWADLGDEVRDAGIAWGAAKAHLHLRRHGPKHS